MNRTKRNILTITGVISAIFGVVLAIPAMLTDRILAAAIGMLLLVAGLVMFAIAFGD